MSIQPHGGQLIQRYEPLKDITKIQQEIDLDAISFSDLELIGVGAYSPIEGFLTKDDYESVVKNMRLSTGIVWSIPITLPVTEEKAATLKIGEQAKLLYDGEVYT